jgi:hypothetical protein
MIEMRLGPDSTINTVKTVLWILSWLKALDTKIDFQSSPTLGINLMADRAVLYVSIFLFGFVFCYLLLGN